VHNGAPFIPLISEARRGSPGEQITAGFPATRDLVTAQPTKNDLDRAASGRTVRRGRSTRRTATHR
jgi:hypothetical protein